MFTVEFSPRSNLDLEQIYDFIALKASPEIAYRYTESILAFCTGLSLSPYRGSGRANLKRGIRVIGFKHRVTIYFRVSNASQIVTIARILYAGRTDRSKK